MNIYNCSIIKVASFMNITVVDNKISILIFSFDSESYSMAKYCIIEVMYYQLPKKSNTGILHILSSMVRWVSFHCFCSLEIFPGFFSVKQLCVLKQKYAYRTSEVTSMLANHHLNRVSKSPFEWFEVWEWYESVQLPFLEFR